jgi:hypothetical protein
VLARMVSFWHMGSRSITAVSDEEISNVDEDIEIPVKPHKRRAVNVLEESEMEPTPEPKASEAKAKQQDGTGAAEDEEEGEEVGEGV